MDRRPDVWLEAEPADTPAGRPQGQARGDGGALRVAAHFPAASPWFDGHFPGRPVLPGVALLALVRAVVARGEPGGVGQRVTGFSRVRFRAAVLPGQRIEGTVSGPREDGSVRFSFTREGERICEGIARLGAALDPADAGLEAWRWR